MLWRAPAGDSVGAGGLVAAPSELPGAPGPPPAPLPLTGQNMLGVRELWRRCRERFVSRAELCVASDNPESKWSEASQSITRKQVFEDKGKGKK